MATYCDRKISADISGYSCTDPMVKGAESTGILINREEINLAGIVYDTTETNVIKTMPLANGTKGYNITQPNKLPFSGTKTELVDGTYTKTWTNTIQFVILAHGTTTAEVIDELSRGEFVAVITNKSGDGSTKHQVYGVLGGLTPSAMVRELYNDDTLAGWLVTMIETDVPISALFVDNTLYGTLTSVAVDNTLDGSSTQIV